VGVRFSQKYPWWIHYLKYLVKKIRKYRGEKEVIFHKRREEPQELDQNKINILTVVPYNYNMFPFHDQIDYIFYINVKSSARPSHIKKLNSAFNLSITYYPYCVLVIDRSDDNHLYFLELKKSSQNKFRLLREL
jgi:hypothetical protein